MELRLLIAYGLIATILLGIAIALAVWLPRRRARKLRLRGVKDYSRSA